MFEPNSLTEINMSFMKGVLIHIRQGSQFILGAGSLGKSAFALLCLVGTGQG